MKKHKKKPAKNKTAEQVPLQNADAQHSDNGIGLPEDIRVVFSEEHNPHDG